MIVYLVWFINFQSERELCRVFSTAEKARAYIAAMSDGDQMEVEECRVDEPIP